MLFGAVADEVDPVLFDVSEVTASVASLNVRKTRRGCRSGAVQGDQDREERSEKEMRTGSGTSPGRC